MPYPLSERSIPVLRLFVVGLSAPCVNIYADEEQRYGAGAGVCAEWQDR